MVVRTDEVKRLIRAIADDPAIIQKLMASSGREEKRSILVEAGLLRSDSAPLSPKDIAVEMEQIFRDEGLIVHIGAPDGRVVEWVGAIAAGAAGAMAA
jgi:hypothetical protein